jgi:hypothetical protein
LAQYYSEEEEFLISCTAFQNAQSFQCEACALKALPESPGFLHCVQLLIGSSLPSLIYLVEKQTKSTIVRHFIRCHVCHLILNIKAILPFLLQFFNTVVRAGIYFFTLYTRLKS